MKDDIKKYPNFYRLAIANFMESTDGKCCYCRHKFIDVDDFIEREVILIERSEKNVIACKECVYKQNLIQHKLK